MAESTGAVQLSTCKLCDSSIVWVRTENAKNLALEPKSRKGVVLVVRSLGPGEPDLTFARIEDVFTPHVVVCAKRKAEKEAAEKAEAES